MKRIPYIAAGFILVLILILTIDYYFGYKKDTNSVNVVDKLEEPSVANLSDKHIVADSNIVVSDSSSDENTVQNKIDPVAQKAALEAEARQAYEKRLEQIRKAGEAKDKHKEWLQSRSEWIDNFPYTPTFHPHAVYSTDPKLTESIEPDHEKMHLLISSAKTPEELTKATKTIEEMLETTEAYNEEIYVNNMRIKNHLFLKTFYASDIKYTEEFEMVHRIMADYGLHDNTKLVAKTFDLLKDYHHSELWTDERRNQRPNYFRGIVGTLLGQTSFVNGENKPSEETAYEIRERLISEIPKAGFLKIKGFFAIDERIRKDLNEGDPLLYR